MRFLMMTNGEEDKAGTPPNPELYAAMGKLIEEMTRAGVLLATGGLAKPIRVKSSNGKVTVTDGPFTEAKEAIAGFALIEAKSTEEAIEYSRRFWKVAGNGEGTIQRVFGPEDHPGQ